MQYNVFMHPVRGLWYWSLDDDDGNSLALCAERFVTRIEAIEAVEKMRRHAPFAPITDSPGAWQDGNAESLVTNLTPHSDR